MDNRDGASRHPIVPGDKFYIAAAFAGVAFLGGVNEKILERLEQERTEPAAMRVGVLEPVVVQYHQEKILGKVLRIFHWNGRVGRRRRKWAANKSGKARPARPVPFALHFRTSRRTGSGSSGWWQTRAVRRHHPYGRPSS